MVDLMSLLSDALIGSFQMFMLNDFGKNMFPYRIKTCWKRILIYGVTALVILSVNHIESTFINIMMIPVSYTIASIVIFQGSVWKKIILACCYYMLAIVPEFLFAVITGAYGVTGTENNFHSELEKLLSLLLMSTITFLLVKCVNQITRKKNYQTIENKLFTVLLTLPAATIIIFMCIYYSQISYTGVNRIMIPIGAALLLMTNICIFAVFDKLIEKSEEVKKMELLYQKSKAENINQKYINKVNEDKRVFLHDVNKFLCTAASLIENGKNLELDSMVRHLGIRMEELKNYSYCADPVLNSILCERKFVAESKGILYKIKLGNNLRTDFIEDLDLISIVGNLLDNAIEAAEKTKKDQHVICNMYMGNEGHLLVMEFYNSYGDFGLQINWDVREGVFPDGMIDDMFDLFQQRIEELAKDETDWNKINGLFLPQWQADERNVANHTETDLPIHLLQSGFMEWAQKAPDRVAVTDGEKKLTYGELHQYALKIRQKIVNVGAKHQDCIAIAMNKSIYQVAAVLGTLYAGCIYVPIVADQEIERAKKILEITNANIVLTTVAENSEYMSGKAIIEVDALSDIKFETELPEYGLEDVAYIIFTSGSTGEPKGVTITHAAAVNTIGRLSEYSIF